MLEGWNNSYRVFVQSEIRMGWSSVKTSLSSVLFLHSVLHRLHFHIPELQEEFLPPSCPHAPATGVRGKRD